MEIKPPRKFHHYRLCPACRGKCRYYDDDHAWGVACTTCGGEGVIYPTKPGLCTTRSLHTLQVRRTHRYADHWKHLDYSEDLGTYSILNWKVIYEAQDFDELDTILYTLRVDSYAGRDDIEDAIRGAFSHSGCDHEHDCCGCAHYHAFDVRRTKRQEWVVAVSGGRNY